MTDPTHRCPLCGAEVTAGLSCPACGVEVSPPGERTAQPAFERSPGGGEGGTRTGGEDRRPARGFPSRLVETLALAGETAFALACRPEASFRSFRFEGRIGPAMAYALVLGGPCLLLGVLIRTRLEGPAGGILDPGMALLLLLAAPPIYLYVRSHALHLGLVLGGRARASFRATFRISAYANASAAPLLLVPFAGEFLFLVWGAYLEATGVRFAHRLTPGAAALAEALPAAVMVLALLAATAIGIFRWTQARG